MGRDKRTKVGGIMVEGVLMLRPSAGGHSEGYKVDCFCNPLFEPVRYTSALCLCISFGLSTDSPFVGEDQKPDLMKRGGLGRSQFVRTSDRLISLLLQQKIQVWAFLFSHVLSFSVRKRDLSKSVSFGWFSVGKC